MAIRNEETASPQETCFACELRHTHPHGIPWAVFPTDTSIALCTMHWNWWVTRFLYSDGAPPCAAHLITSGGESDVPA